MKPNLNLTLNDPLAEHAITIVLHLAPGENLNQRPMLVSLGIPNQLPIQTQGILADLERLVRTTWTSFGMQMKANAAATVPVTDTDDALEEGEVDDETDEATAPTTLATAPITPAIPAKRATTTQPTLSLF